jgi:beta-glucanase (GH16 family)
MKKKWLCLFTSLIILSSSPLSRAAATTTVTPANATAGATTAANATTNSTLVWSDEFNGTSLNTSNWTYETGTGSNGWGNNELEYYTKDADNVSVSNGTLKIRAVKKNHNGCSYTSGRIKTQGLKAFRYGKIEARIAAPAGQGLWPACWMLGNNFPTVGWPNCGEIDIFEHINLEDKVYGTVHWDSNGYATYGGKTAGVDVTKYHLYGITWDKDYIRWFVDGKQYHEILIKDGTGGTEEFQKDFFLLLNLAVGGNWPGSPDSKTAFPATMYVDYIRVYQNNGSGSIPSSGSTPNTDPNPTITNVPTNTDGKLKYTGTDQASVSLSNVNWADIHYKVNNNTQMNVRMTQSGSTASYTIRGLKTNDVVTYWFTSCEPRGLAKDGSSSTYTHTSAQTSSNAITSSTASTAANFNSTGNRSVTSSDTNTSKSSNHSSPWNFIPNLWNSLFGRK